MPARLADRLASARRNRFVGRGGEIRLFEAALGAEEPPFQILYLYGPGGVGKTTLLRELAALAERNGAKSIYLDARNTEPSPYAFLGALAVLLELEPNASMSDALAQRAGRNVILVDTYELLSPLENWLREEFFPDLPENTLVVVAGREPPAAAWHSDPGWQTLMRAVSLRNLSPEEGRAYLKQRQVPEAQLRAILDFTHGHPLALSLVADAFDQRPALALHAGEVFKPEAAPDIVKTLLAQFVQKVPGPAHRAALEASALVRVVTESKLAAMLHLPDPTLPATAAEPGAQTAHDMFEWLRGLSFMDASAEGLYPHNLAREALIADLRWRNPDWYTELHRRARNYHLQQLHATSGIAQQRILFDYIFLHRDNPVVRPFFEWASSGTLATDVLKLSDIPALAGIVARYEGEDAADLAAQWMQTQPEGFLVLRDSEIIPAGLLASVRLDRASPQQIQADPGTANAVEFLNRHAPLRPGEAALLFRFWMGRDTYQNVSPAQSLIFVNVVRQYLATPGLAYTFFPVADPTFWSDVLNYADLHRIPEADFTVDDKTFGVYGHDWRVTPPLSWLTLLAERETAPTLDSAPPPPATMLLVLSRDEFDSAAHDALRDFSRPHRLRENPLLRSRIVVERAGGGASADARMTALQTLLQEAVQKPQVSPREAKLYRAVQYTYLKPTMTQEQAAEALDLPFSTYRRHLKAGMIRVTDALWQQEIGAGTR
ncbi:MAG: AAA family ATPase [Chloroflexi bacterium]|nr:AAA family ATPase [Chloroflexota bacterium]